MKSKLYILSAVSLLISAVLFSSCAPVYKANINYTLSENVIWPGKPEKPRIKYLWSLYSLAPETTLADFLAGGGDPSDPKSSLVLLRPFGLYLDNDRLYITDIGAMRVTAVNLKTMDVIQIGVGGKGDLISPVGVAADRTGNVYVTDSELDKVLIYDKDGNFLKTFSNVKFQRPTGIAYDRERDLIYVVDTAGHMVYGIGTDGNVRFSFGGRGSNNGEFNYPAHIAIDREGKVYVSDTLNFRIQCFDRQGKFLFKFGRLGDSRDALTMPKGVAVDSEDNIYVVDSGQDIVKIFNKEGRLLLFFGESEKGKGLFWLPAGIFIDKDDKIYVADTFNQSVRAFQFLGGK